MLGRRKRGSEDEAIGRSRGGLSTKISAGVDALGNPVRFILTGGQVNDILQAEDLISGLPFEHLLADKGYDANWLRARVAETGAEAVIPSTRSRSQAIPHDKHIYQAQSGRALLQQNQALSSHRHPLREDSGIVRSHVILSRRHDLAPVNVNRT
jgi:transposase